MASQIRKMLKKFIVLSISFQIYTLAGAYLFIYVEDCLPGKRTTVIDENFLHYLKERSDLNEDDKIKVLNVTTSYQMNMDETECSYQLPNVLKWWEFTIVTCATIGYGHTTPKTDLGKVLLMFFATLGIPLALAVYTTAGEIIEYWIDYLITKIERKCCRRQQVKNVARKRFFVASLLVLTVMMVGTWFSVLSSKLSFIDSLYFGFQTLTTIGYGDVSYKGIMPIYSFIFTISTGAFSMGIVASLISSVGRLLQHPKAIKKISFSRKSWSLKKGQHRQSQELKDDKNMATFKTSEDVCVNGNHQWNGFASFQRWTETQFDDENQYHDAIKGKTGDIYGVGNYSRDMRMRQYGHCSTD